MLTDTCDSAYLTDAAPHPGAPEWRAEVDRVTAEDWSRLIDLFEDANIYQTWQYGEAHWGRRSLSHLVVKRDGGVVGIAQLRIVRPTPLPFGMAYLRWGPLCHRRGAVLDQEIAARVVREIEAEYVRRRKLFLRVLPNAFEGSARAEVIGAAFVGFKAEPADPDNTYRTFVLDLSRDMAELRKRLDKKWRNMLARAEKNGLRVIEGTRKEEFLVFREMYRQMRQRKKFETTVDIDEFCWMQEHLPERQRMRVLLCEDDGVMVAGLVVSAMGDSAIYLLGATSDDGLNAKGSYLLQWTLLHWLKANGLRWYDLGGIDPIANPGVYSFKKGFSGEDAVQMSARTACASMLSAGVVKAGFAVHRLRRRGRAAHERAKN